ncbi:MAG: histidyl-tRNA synthetase [Thermoleophilia bacterium]|jgi:histidyl-tRNA synthetase|nr:histidyl-tRNA synthetase [Thermoleophilia bacterium]
MTQFQVPKGTQDVLPADWRLRLRIFDAARRRFDAAGYGRISTPTFEHTELFHRGVGEATDIVSKETYTFDDRGGRSLTLRPEGTAGVARAFANHGMHREPLPVKLWYSASMFRYEKPQSGRLREHEQLGCELFGSALPAADAEAMSIQAGIYRDLGLPDVVLHVNSIGSGESREAFREALVAYLTPFADELDADSQVRLQANPLRILDSKDARTREIIAGAPLLPDFLTDADRAHFEAVCRLLDAADVTYVVDPLLVRGFDYYTSTVWEFTSSALGAQSAVGAGGRYDALVEAFGGPSTPAVGFGTGVERIVLCLEAMEATSNTRSIDAYVGVAPDAADAAWVKAFRLAATLRERGRAVDIDLAGRSPKGQAKQASKLDVAARVLFDDLGGRMFLRGDFEGSDLPADVETAIGHVDAQLAAARASG